MRRRPRASRKSVSRPILLDLPHALVGERVLVRPYRSGDGPALEEAVNASLEHLRPWMPWARKRQSRDDSEELVRTFEAKWILREDLVMGIWPLDETRLLGGTGLHRIDWDARNFEIGYWIRPDEEGKGLVTETVLLLCELAFGVLQGNRVQIRSNSRNLRSIAVPTRLGFSHEATLRNDRLSREGKVVDTEVFAMTREDWMKAVATNRRS